MLNPILCISEECPMNVIRFLFLSVISGLTIFSITLMSVRSEAQTLDDVYLSAIPYADHANIHKFELGTKNHLTFKSHKDARADCKLREGDKEYKFALETKNKELLFTTKKNREYGLFVNIDNPNKPRLSAVYLPQTLGRVGIESIEKPIYLCKLSIIDPKTKKPSRVGFKKLKDGKKVRFLKKSGETLT